MRHTDVTDLAWSPEDRYLASVGLDSQVLIWSGYTLGGLLRHKSVLLLTWNGHILLQRANTQN